MQFDQLDLNFDISPFLSIDRHRIMIAYDTPCNRRRRKFAKTALSYATRVQKSVYEADLTDSQLRILAINFRLLCTGEDDIRLYPQCSRCAALRQFLGKAAPIASPLLVVA